IISPVLHTERPDLPHAPPIRSKAPTDVPGVGGRADRGLQRQRLALGPPSPRRGGDRGHEGQSARAVPAHRATPLRRRRPQDLQAPQAPWLSNLEQRPPQRRPTDPARRPIAPRTCLNDTPSVLLLTRSGW